MLSFYSDSKSLRRQWRVIWIILVGVKKMLTRHGSSTAYGMLPVKSTHDAETYLHTKQPPRWPQYMSGKCFFLLWTKGQRATLTLFWCIVLYLRGNYYSKGHQIAISTGRVSLWVLTFPWISWCRIQIITLGSLLESQLGKIKNKLIHLVANI